MLGTSRIAAVRFSHDSSENILASSHALIVSTDLFRGTVPYDGGVYDSHLGTTSHDYLCATCGENKKNDKGHNGHILLNQPVISPLAIADNRKWCKAICFTCGKCIIHIRNFKSRGSKLLDDIVKYIGSNVRKCVHCSTPHPVIRKNPVEPLGLVAINSEDIKNPKYDLLPHMLLKIYGRVSHETVQELGRKIHPINYVLTHVRVPTSIIRPDAKKIGNTRSSNDDLTTMLQNIIKFNDPIPSTVPVDYGPEYIKSIYNLQNALNDLMKSKSETGNASIAVRIKGKHGRARKNQLGKRVFEIARSTIVGDPTLAIDELKIPMDVAKKLYVVEKVQEYNKSTLLGYCLNGTKKYPGAIKYIRNGVEYSVDTVKDIELETGDEVLRNLIDGDLVLFNRQPSLMDSNITCMKILVSRDPKNKTFMMNVLICKYFNADLFVRLSQTGSCMLGCIKYLAW